VAVGPSTPLASLNLPPAPPASLSLPSSVTLC
ncbi:MAG: hypothetical protein QOE90_3575, partial [Thermoplasmata archaeon]|nr:hypothetical protein [Thermoplasmata archaeon]